MGFNDRIQIVHIIMFKLMTHCPTCNDTRRIRIGNEYKECPICRKLTPELITLTIGDTSIKNVEISEVLDQITPDQALNHYGHEKLLDAMDGWQIREYMKPTYEP